MDGVAFVITVVLAGGAAVGGGGSDLGAVGVESVCGVCLHCDLNRDGGAAGGGTGTDRDGGARVIPAGILLGPFRDVSFHPQCLPEWILPAD